MFQPAQHLLCESVDPVICVHLVSISLTHTVDSRVKMGDSDDILLWEWVAKSKNDLINEFSGKGHIISATDIVN